MMGKRGNQRLNYKLWEDTVSFYFGVLNIIIPQAKLLYIKHNQTHKHTKHG